MSKRALQQEECIAVLMLRTMLAIFTWPVRLFSSLASDCYVSRMNDGNSA